MWGVLVLGALASLPLEASKLNNADHYARTAQHFEVDLHTLVRNPVARGWIRRCPTVGFHTNRVRPFLLVMVDGVPCKAQVSVTVTLVGSKPQG